MSREDRKNWKSGIQRVSEKSEGDDFWLDMTPEERVDFVWTLSLETWNLANPGRKDEPGLPRSIARIVRRKR